jgi:hypothetical protein
MMALRKSSTKEPESISNFLDEYTTTASVRIERPVFETLCLNWQAAKHPTYPQHRWPSKTCHTIPYSPLGHIPLA